MRYKKIDWKYYHGALLPTTAPHIELKLNKSEEKELLALSKAYFLRYVSDWDSKEGAFWYVIKDGFGGIDELSANTRSKVRRGLKQCIVKEVSAEVIATEGYESYKQAFENYTTDMRPKGKDEFQKEVLSLDSCQFWAVYKKDEDKLIAYSQNIIEDHSVNYSTIKFHPAYMKYYSSYALFFTMNEYYLNEKKFNYVNDGARSISHATNIQDFLIEKFNFRKAYCKLHIVYRWDIGLLVNILYPFRTLIKKVDHKISNRLSVLLTQEEIRRSFER